MATEKMASISIHTFHFLGHVLVQRRTKQENSPKEHKNFKKPPEAEQEQKSDPIVTQTCEKKNAYSSFKSSYNPVDVLNCNIQAYNMSSFRRDCRKGSVPSVMCLLSHPPQICFINRLAHPKDDFPF